MSLKTAAKPLVGLVQNEAVLGENGDGISKEQSYESKIHQDGKEG